MNESSNPDTGTLVDLVALAVAGGARSGPRWSTESTDLDITLLAWSAGEAIASHRNDEVDVLLVVVAGMGAVTVNGVVHVLTPGQALLIPKGAERAVRCTGPSFSYLSVHRRRRGLW